MPSNIDTTHLLNEQLQFLKIFQIISKAVQ